MVSSSKRDAGEAATASSGNNLGKTIKKLKTATGTEASSLAKDAVSQGASAAEASSVVDGKPSVLRDSSRVGGGGGGGGGGGNHEDDRSILDENMDLDRVVPHSTADSNGEPVERQKSEKSLAQRHLPDPIPPLSSLKGQQYTYASLAIEAQVYAASTAVFCYETTTGNDSQAFGNPCHTWSQREETSPSNPGSKPKVLSMQTRAGAASIISGYLAPGSPSTSTAATDAKVVSALTNSASFASMAPQLSSLSSNTGGKVVIHVSAQGTVTSPVKALYEAPSEDSQGGLPTAEKHSIAADALQIVMDYITVVEAIRQLDGFQVIFSANAAEAISNTKLIYEQPGHFIHVFDGVIMAREYTRLDLSSFTHTIDLGRPASFGGNEKADTVFIGLASTPFELIGLSQPKAGFIKISSLRPWSPKQVLALIPSSAKVVKVVEQSRHGQDGGLLYEEVLTSVLEMGMNLRIVPAPFSLTGDLSQGKYSAACDLTLSSHAAHPLPPQTKTKTAVFFDTDNGSTASTAPLVSAMFAQDGSVYPSLASSYDNFLAGGIVRHTLRLSPAPLCASLGSDPEEDANLVVVGDVAVLKELDVTKRLAQNGVLLINTSWQPEELDARLHPNIRKHISAKKATLFLFDMQRPSGIEDSNGKATQGDETRSSVILHIAFLLLYTGQGKLPGVVRTALESFYTKSGFRITDLLNNIPRALFKVDIPDTWSDPPSPGDGSAPILPLRASMIPNGTAPNPYRTFAEATPSRSSWAQPAWHLMFPEAYGTDPKALRPDLPEKNYLVTVTENRRLTPLTYDRNIFHIEFDITGTGLHYDVGEALGIHGWNDSKEIQEFIDSYGLKADQIVNFPSREDPTRVESRTIYQVLQQNLDIFGKPGKTFYGQLAEHAKDVNEERILRFFGSAEGSASFKKRAEIDTVTFADVLREFPSARPSFEDLLSIISPIKPRHYSIASSIKAHPNSVHLLVVTVDWMTPSGSPRYGQCTRYLVGLQPGAKVMVSIKPSVMKMPPNDMQPIIMAGLGTGLAPFMAYLQERAYRKNVLGKEVGPMALYLGSRYRAMEFLYGEQLLAYEADGLLTILGLAFSRDQNKKVYIQHLMERDAKTLGPWLTKENALTTLCGPTWPVPDFYNAMISALQSTGMENGDSEKFIEHAKEDERYVLEVY